MDWAGMLRAELAKAANQWAVATGLPSYRSLGSLPATMFSATADGRAHGNFSDAAWQAINTSADWAERLKKPHSRRRALPTSEGSLAMELDSSNSSDALLMNLFCPPGAARRLARFLEASPDDGTPVFGFHPRIELVDASAEATEIDMRMGDTIFEAKLTERDFTSRRRDHVFRYRALPKVFEVALLPGDKETLHGYQLIRNVLAAAQHGLRLIVLLDGRRPDLLHEWWRVHAAISDGLLRQRCGWCTWQELALASSVDQQEFLRVKYGL